MSERLAAIKTEVEKPSLLKLLEEIGLTEGKVDEAGIIKLLVGDHYFHVDKRILLSKNDTFFTKLLSDRWKNDDQELTINRPYKYFIEILNYLNGQKPRFWGWKFSQLEQLATEADFYGLTEFHNEIQELMGPSHSQGATVKDGCFEVVHTSGVVNKRIKMTGRASLLFKIKDYEVPGLIQLLAKFRRDNFSSMIGRYGLFVEIVPAEESSLVNIVDPWMGPLFMNGNQIMDMANEMDMQFRILWIVVHYERWVFRDLPDIPDQDFVFEYEDHSIADNQAHSTT